MMKKALLLLVTIAMIAGACSVEKRTYRSGYHVTWKKNHHTGTTVAGQAAEKKNEIALQPTAPRKAALLSTESAPATLAPAAPQAEAVETIRQSTVEKNTLSETEIVEKEVKEMVTETRQIEPLAVTTQLDKAGITQPMGIIGVIVGIILCLVGLSPLGVLIANGESPSFWVNLLLWLLTGLVFLVGAVTSTGGIGGIFLIMGIILGLISLIHGIVVIVRGE